MDCFYAAVEVKHRPELRGKPLGIGGPPNSRSVLCTASYEARKFGVRSAMPTSRAVRLCPDLIVIRPRFELYKKESLAVRAILDDYSERIQPLSLDEAYLDVTGSTHFGGSATRIAQEIRARVAGELDLTVSAGVAPNKFLAKIASDWKKPNGLFVIRPADVPEFVRALPVEKIWGVGRVTAKKMHDLGLRTCEDIQRTELWQLAQWFGAGRAAELQDLARGLDSRPVQAHGIRKSLTVEETFRDDLKSLNEIVREIPALYEDFDRRMTKAGLRDRVQGWVVKVKFFDFKSTTHERSGTAFPTPADFAALLEKAWERRAEPVRLIGLGARIDSGETEEEDDGPQLRLPL